MFSLVSEETDEIVMTDKEIYSLIDTSLENQDNNLDTILNDITIEHPSYEDFEDYILDYASKLAESNDLTYPLLLTETILYLNLENEDAQNLYVILINKNIEIKERVEVEKEIVNIKREEITIFNEETEEMFQFEEYMAAIAKRSKELESITSLYTDELDEIKYTTNTYFYPISYKNYTSEVYDGYFDRDEHFNHSDGFGLDFGIGSGAGFFNWRIDFTGNLTYEDLFVDEERQVITDAIFSFGRSIYNIPLFLRAGFLYNYYGFNSDDFETVAVLELPSPTIGIGINGYSFLKILKLDLSFDFLIAPLYTDNLDLGINSKTYLTVNLIRVGGINIEIRGGMDTLYLNEDGLSEVSYIPKFGFGVSRYE